jgi:hypothetical protein
LSYCCAVAQRIDRIADAYPGRVCKIDFDRLCQSPETACEQVARFAGAPASEETIAWFADLVRQGAPETGRYKTVDRSVFDPADLKYVGALGYDVEE